jgi:hypothetical protein
MIIIGWLLALLLSLFWGGFFFRMWIFHHRPNRLIRDTDGDILFFDPWRAIDEWIHNRRWHERG